LDQHKIHSKEQSEEHAMKQDEGIMMDDMKVEIKLMGNVR
jgi:hypothetical protein